MPTLTELQPNTRMPVAPTPGKIWTERELLALPKDEGKHELVDGEIVLMSPANHTHGEVCVNILSPLREYVKAKRLGKVYDGQTGFWMVSGNTRSPDVSFVSHQRLDALPRPLGSFLRTAPDLVIEVLSPGERRRDIERKLADYFSSGTRLAWFVFQRSKSVRVYCSPVASALLGEHEILSGEDVVPGFVLPIKDIFEGL